MAKVSAIPERQTVYHVLSPRCKRCLVPVPVTRSNAASHETHGFSNDVLPTFLASFENWILKTRHRHLLPLLTQFYLNQMPINGVSLKGVLLTKLNFL